MSAVTVGCGTSASPSPDDVDAGGSSDAAVGPDAWGEASPAVEDARTADADAAGAPDGTGMDAGGPLDSSSAAAPDAPDAGAIDSSLADVANVVDAADGGSSGAGEPDAPDAIANDAQNSEEAGDAGADGGPDATDAQSVDSGPWFDASGLDAGALCNPWGGPVTQIAITYVDAAVPPPSTFVGGAIESGTYVLTSLVVYPGAFGNAGTTGEILTVDLVTSTMRNVYSDQGGTPVYAGYGFQLGASGSNSFRLFALCPTSGASAPIYYSFSGTGPGATLTWFHGDQVAVLTQQ